MIFVKKAAITKEQRKQFELLGTEVIAQGLVSGTGANRAEAADWLREQRACEKLCTCYFKFVAFVVLVFAVIGILSDLGFLAKPQPARPDRSMRPPMQRPAPTSAITLPNQQ
jgi:hypothetical protein